MTRLVHLTDLHFGLHRADLVAPLREAILKARPDVVVASGDLTQRALRGQFAQAMAFLRSLDTPFMVTPGNHDLPAYNPLMRLFDPFGPFRRGAARDLTPTARIGSLRLFTVNTADPFSWRGGVARTQQIDVVCAALRDGPADLTNIAICHHPLEEPPGFQRGETRGGAEALERLAEAGVRVALSGHLHHWSTGLGIEGEAGRPIFQMQTGTGLCARDRERNHGFAAIDFVSNRLSVARWIVSETTKLFVPTPAEVFTFHGGKWMRDR